MKLKPTLNFAMFVIVLNVLAQADSIGSWAVGLVFAAVVYFAGNRISRLIEKIDAVSEFVIRQIAKNGNVDEKFEDIKAEQKLLEGELKDQINRIERKLDGFIAEIRKDRVS